MWVLRLLVLVASSCGATAQTCAGYSCPPPLKLREQADTLPCLQWCNKGSCCVTGSPAPVSTAGPASAPLDDPSFHALPMSSNCANFACPTPGFHLRYQPELLSCDGSCNVDLCCLHGSGADPNSPVPGASTAAPTVPPVPGASTTAPSPMQGDPISALEPARYKVTQKHCRPGPQFFLPVSLDDAKVQTAVTQGLEGAKAERMACSAGPLPLFFDAASFLDGTRRTHYVHAQFKFDATCMSETFKLDFHISTGNASSFVLHVNREFGSGAWKLLDADPKPCYINTGTVSSPIYVPESSKFVIDAAVYAAAELTYQQRKAKCLPGGQQAMGWQVKKVVTAMSTVFTGLMITLRLELQAGAASPQTGILIVLQTCEKFPNSCFYQLRIKPPATICSPFVEEANSGTTRSLGMVGDDPTDLWEAQRNELLKPRKLGVGRNVLQLRHIRTGKVPKKYDPTGLMQNVDYSAVEQSMQDCFKKIPVYNQGKCGSCYAAAVSQMIGIRLCLHEQTKEKTSRRLDSLPDDEEAEERIEDWTSEKFIAANHEEPDVEDKDIEHDPDGKDRQLYVAKTMGHKDAVGSKMYQKKNVDKVKELNSNVDKEAATAFEEKQEPAHGEKTLNKYMAQTPSGKTVTQCKSPIYMKDLKRNPKCKEGYYINVGETCTPQCPQGEEPAPGPSKLHCEAGGILIPSKFECQDKGCEAPADILHSGKEACKEIKAGVKIKSDKTCEAQCDLGYDVIHSDSKSDPKAQSKATSKSKVQKVELACKKGKLSPSFFSCQAKPEVSKFEGKLKMQVKSTEKAASDAELAAAIKTAVEKVIAEGKPGKLQSTAKIMVKSIETSSRQTAVAVFQVLTEKEAAGVCKTGAAFWTETGITHYADNLGKLKATVKAKDVFTESQRAAIKEAGGIIADTAADKDKYFTCKNTGWFSAEDIAKAALNKDTKIKAKAKITANGYPEVIGEGNPREVMRHGYAVGDEVCWKGADTDVPRGSIGKVARFTKDDKVGVKFPYPLGTWLFKPEELETANQFGFTIGENVLWKHFDAEVPKGSVGTIVGFPTGPKKGKKLTVRFTKGTWNFDKMTIERANKAEICKDSDTWSVTGDFGWKGASINYQGSYDCKFFGAADPGCKKHKDIGQKTHCRKTCGTCPFTSAPTSPWADAWYKYMPSLNQVTQCTSTDGSQSNGCKGGGLHGVWNNWMRSMSTDLWQMGAKCMPYTLKCMADGVVNPLSGGNCELFSKYELWHRPCSCIPNSVRPTTLKCPLTPPTAACSIPVPPAMFIVKHMGHGLTNAEAVLNIQRHITESGSAGPVWISFDVTTGFVDNNWKLYPVYRGGKYSSQGGGEEVPDGEQIAGAHAVIAVGWGKMVLDYWLLRNSWSTDWGEKGYFKFRRGINLDNIESKGIGVSMPTTGFKDWEIPVCHLKSGFTSPKFNSMNVLINYTYSPVIRCTKACHVTLFISNRLNSRTEIQSNTAIPKGTYHEADVDAYKDHPFKPISLAGLGFGTLPGSAWIQMKSRDTAGNVGDSSVFVEFPAAANAPRLLQERALMLV